VSTNYYVAKNLCECCKRYDTEYHIGKASWGWAFTFQGYPYDKLTSWKLYKEYLKDKIIMDEYGERVDYNWFVSMIENEKSPNYKRQDGHVNLSHNEYGKKQGYFNPEYDWTDEDGYSFTRKEFS
jgi:hypothetical protein